MNRIIPTAAALMLAISVPQAAEAQNPGQGKGKGAERAQERGGPDRGAPPGRGRDEARGRGPERVARDARPDVRDMREMARHAGAPGRGERRIDRPSRPERDLDDAVRTVFRAEPGRGLIAGCPPGLAKRNNGCLPPGLERKVVRDRYAGLWGRDRDGDWRYESGYLYQVDPRGSVKGWLPALGGALAAGAVWPSQYAYQAPPPYYTDYFRLNDPYDYRYANGALYGVDPRTQAITQVVALLTGQPITVGQPMPAGYDVYNVPYQYRDQYVDTAAARYRYNDGYVYQIDPTTQLVQAAIQLLT